MSIKLVFRANLFPMTIFTRLIMKDNSLDKLSELKIVTKILHKSQVEDMNKL